MLGALEVVLEGAGVVDFESLLLLELDEAWLSGAADDIVGEETRRATRGVDVTDMVLLQG